MRTLKKWLYLKAISYLTKDLLHLVEADDILRIVNDDEWFIGKKQIDKNHIRALQSDVEVFRKSTLWKLIRQEGYRQANYNMFIKGQSEVDMLSGKMLLYYIRLIDDLTLKMKRRKKK